jgi:hypothetical protein
MCGVMDVLRRFVLHAYMNLGVQDILCGVAVCRLVECSAQGVYV